MDISLSEEHHFKGLKLTALVERLIQCRDDLEIRNLKDEFYRRLGVQFFSRCHHITHKLYGSFPDWEATRDDVFQETFITALEIIQEKFNMQHDWKDTDCEEKLLNWLSAIANNKLLNLIKRERKEKENLDQYLIDYFADRAPGSIGKRKHYQPTYDKVKFDQVWSRINPMSKEILLLSLEYDTLREDNEKHLPDNVLAYLTNKYGVSKTAIRQAKSRALRALHSCKI